MLDALRDGEIDGVLVWKPDRAYRSLGSAADLADALEAGKASFHAVQDSVDAKSLPIYAAVASMERQAIRERAKLGKVGAAKIGRVPAGVMPVGYRRGPDGRPVIHDGEAELVRRIYTESVNGRGTKEIAHGLNLDGVPTPNGKGLRWEAAQVSRLLRSETYAGRWQYADTGVTVDFPPITPPYGKPLRTHGSSAQAAPSGTRRRAGTCCSIWSHVRSVAASSPAAHAPDRTRRLTTPVKVCSTVWPVARLNT